MQFQLHRHLPQDPDRVRARRRSHSAATQFQGVHRLDHRSSRRWRHSHRPPLCRRLAPPRNPDPSLFWCSCAAAMRAVPGTAVAGPRVSARPAGFFGIAHGPPAATPSGSARRSPPRNILALGHTGDTRTPACRSAGNQTPVQPPAPPTRPPAGRWTAPGQAGIKAMLHGSPPSNRNGRGPGVRWPIVTRALAYLDRSRDLAATPMRRPLPTITMKYLQDKNAV